MEKYTNVVRFLVKEGQQEAFESRFSEARPWKGLLQHILAKALSDDDQEHKAIKARLINTPDKLGNTPLHSATGGTR